MVLTGFTSSGIPDTGDVIRQDSPIAAHPRGFPAFPHGLQTDALRAHSLSGKRSFSVLAVAPRCFGSSLPL